MTKIIETPTLETKRLILRPIALDHAESLEKHFNNWNIIKNLNDRVPWPYPKGGVADHIKTEALPDMLGGKALLWTIFLKDQPDDPIGRLDFRIIHTQPEQGDRGFWLAEPFWGLGLMTEAVACLNDYVFDVLGRDKITVQNYVDNIGSHRVKEKTGSVLIRTEIQKWRDQGREVEVWELTADNWRKFKSRDS
ncbi:MAG: GNAT family N-acetyltransferase [Alphaproteobacteria bacterium]|nr:GNAT family N-acetyltransferase [Alphaproteobacteria bacterium]